MVEDVDLRQEITALRASIRTIFEGGVRSDDPVLVTTAETLLELEKRLGRLEQQDTRAA